MLARAANHSIQKSVYCNAWKTLVSQWRGLTSDTTGKKGGGSDARETPERKESAGEPDDEDGFGMEDFVTHEEEEEPEETVDVEETMNQLEGTEVTPEIASELVSRMVDATARSLERRNSIHGNILTSLTPHSISVLRASRICTNTVHAAGTEVHKYPIEKRVTAELQTDLLDLTDPAREALYVLSGPRVKARGKLIRLSCDRFPSKDENRAYIVTRLHCLVEEAKLAVGQTVDLSPLDSWDDVVREVEQQAGDEIEEAGSVQRVLGVAEN